MGVGCLMAGCCHVESVARRRCEASALAAGHTTTVHATSGARAFEKMGWRLERRGWVLATLVPSCPVPLAWAAWGHHDHPRSNPIVATCAPIERWHETVEACVRSRVHAVLLLEATTDQATWQATVQVLRSVPAGTTLYVLGPADLSHHVLRRLRIQSEA